MAAEKTISDIEIAAAISKSKGFTGAASKLLGVTQRQVRRRIAANEELRELIRDEREYTSDRVELKLLESVEKGNIAAIIFYLKTQCKDRGYIERVQVEDFDSVPIEELREMAKAKLRESDAAEE